MADIDNYSVNYDINVKSDGALASIQQFVQATEKLDSLSSRFASIKKHIEEAGVAFKSISNTPINIQINAENVEKTLDRVLAKIKLIRQEGARGTVVNVKTNTTTPKLTPIASKSASSAATPAAFSSASVNQFTELKNALAGINALMPKINKKQLNDIKVTANVTNAINSLESLLAKINEIKANSKLTITASAAGASGAVHNASPKPKRTKSTSAPRPPKPSAGQSKYLYPSTRQVLGPTYANNGTIIAGEMLKGMGMAYGLSTVMTGITTAFKDATSYDNITQTTKNILQTHDKNPMFEGRFAEMNKTMRQVGIDTKFTAPQVASAGKFLAMSGFNVDQIKQAIRPIADIALVGDTDLGETADVVTNIMTSYAVPAEKMNDIADILTMTFTKTNTTLMELAESFKYAGTVAYQSGMKFETTSAALGILGDAGIKGSHAGTTLRMLLMNMTNPTKKAQEAWDILGISPRDAQGNLKPLSNILEELKNKSQGLSKGAFTQLTTTMARITAVPGFLALIKNVDKLKEVEQLNAGATGLSSKLAEEKKNTIEGLWYQMTSAFTESGMKGFEAIQDCIRDFLHRMIVLMRSPDFAKSLQDAMKMFLRLADAVISAFQKIVSVWNWIPDWIKSGIVHFVKLQMYIGIIVGLSKTAFSTIVAIRSVLMGQWFSASFGRLAVGLARFVSLFNMARQVKNLGVFMSAWVALTHSLRYNIRQIKLAINATAQVPQGVLARGAWGNFFGRLGGASPLGALKLLFTSLPGQILLAVGTLTTVVLTIRSIAKATDEANRITNAWVESYKNLGIESMDLSDPNFTIIGNMRIFNNELTTHAKKISQAGDLWHRYWIEKNGPETKTNIADAIIDTPSEAGKQYKKTLEIADNKFGNGGAFQTMAEQLGGTYKYSNNQIGYALQQLTLLGHTYSGTSRAGSADDRLKAILTLAQFASNPNHPKFQEVEAFLTNGLIVNAPSSYRDIERILGAARDKYKIDLKTAIGIPSGFDIEDAQKISIEDAERFDLYGEIQNQKIEQIIKRYEALAQLYRNVENKQDISGDQVQNVLRNSFGLLFDSQFGAFGSEDWVNKINSVINTPSQYGFNKNTVAPELSAYWMKGYADFMTMYNAVPDNIKPLLLPYLQASSIGQILVGQDKQQFKGVDFKLPEKIGQTATFNGVKYTGKQVAPYPDLQWVDKNGKIYLPTTPGITPDSDELNVSLHNGTDQSDYKSHYDRGSAAPKQVIVKIENLMKVDKQVLDFTDEQRQAINNAKQELASMLLDVVQDFNANMI